VDLRAGLDDLEKIKFLTLPGLELRRLGRPARSVVGIATTLSRLRRISKKKIILIHGTNVQYISLSFPISIFFTKMRGVEKDA
jgi:hypothetical protein